MIALMLKYLTGNKFIFDMRGFWADEKIDAGHWKLHGYSYKFTKWLEKKFLLNADHVVSLTHEAEKEIKNFSYLDICIPPITVIPTCTNLERFCPKSRDNNSPFILGYVGSTKTWRHFEYVVACFAYLKKINPEAKMLVINKGEHEYIKKSFIDACIAMDTIEILAVNYPEVPYQIHRMNAGIFFYKQTFSRKACSPTKLGEFLGCGIPCLSNTGVGDIENIMNQDGVGVTVADFNQKSLEIGVEKLLKLTKHPNISEVCVASARRHFSLEDGIAKYKSIYLSLQ